MSLTPIATLKNHQTGLVSNGAVFKALFIFFNLNNLGEKKVKSFLCNFSWINENKITLKCL